MKRSAGFTLIELVIVIIILGILAVTAAPKFLNLQDDAKKAAADGVKAAVASSAQIVYSKAVINGYEKDASGKTVTVADGKAVDLIYGYPAATSTGIGNAADIDIAWKGTVSGASNETFVYATSGSTCTVVYTQATSTAGATTAKSGC
jgi:MSHA pilin protein MshA